MVKKEECKSKEIELYIYRTEAKAPAKAPAKTEHMSVLTRGYHRTTRHEKVTIGLGSRWAGALQSSITRSLKSYEEEYRESHDSQATSGSQGNFEESRERYATAASGREHEGVFHG